VNKNTYPDKLITAHAHKISCPVIYKTGDVNDLAGHVQSLAVPVIVLTGAAILLAGPSKHHSRRKATSSSG
jgi:GTP:adenosylcobinamide-phosphate guanylyltransferase